jgi:Putative restriction endonuclease
MHPGAQTAEEERTAAALIAEVTSPVSPDTVLNDRETKPREYARAGIPLYLLVDQERGEWVLHALAEGWQRYQIAASGKYGEPVPLPQPFGFAIESIDWPRLRAEPRRLPGQAVMPERVSAMVMARSRMSTARSMVSFSITSDGMSWNRL